MSTMITWKRNMRILVLLSVLLVTIPLYADDWDEGELGQVAEDGSLNLGKEPYFYGFPRFQKRLVADSADNR